MPQQTFAIYANAYACAWSTSVTPAQQPAAPLAPLARLQAPSSAQRTASPTGGAGQLDETLPSMQDVEAIPGPPYRCPYLKCTGKKDHPLLSSLK